MAEIVWSEVGQRFFEAGVDHGVFYNASRIGVPWNGLISVDEKSSGGEISEYHFDGVKYLDFVENEDFEATLEAFTYPDEFEWINGYKTLVTGVIATRQPHNTFSLSYRTKVGNDVESVEYGSKIHLIYNIIASPMANSNSTISEEPDATTFKWNLQAVPEPATGYKPTAHFIVDSSKFKTDEVARSAFGALEEVLYGSPTESPYLPTTDLIVWLFTPSADDVINGLWPSTVHTGNPVDGGTYSSAGTGRINGGTPYHAHQHRLPLRPMS